MTVIGMNDEVSNPTELKGSSEKSRTVGQRKIQTDFGADLDMTEHHHSTVVGRKELGRSGQFDVDWNCCGRQSEFEVTDVI